MYKPVHVVAGVLSDKRGRVLIAQRQAGTHMAGFWEFPGGKLKPDESRRDGLVRELSEELGISVTECTPLIRLHHSYPEKNVLLDFWQVYGYDGDPTGIEGQALKWVELSNLPNAGILEADKPVINALRLPDRYAITPPLNNNSTGRQDAEAIASQIRLAKANGATLIQLRVLGVTASELRLLTVAALQAAPDTTLLINGDPSVTVPIAASTGAAGIHVPSRYLSQIFADKIDDRLLVGASCHNIEELNLAAQSGAHFAVLGPVQKTLTHPDIQAIGWGRFAALVERAVIPVYALGGVGPDNIKRARSVGAQGIAGIRAFF